jgi:hypothetical protein
MSKIVRRTMVEEYASEPEDSATPGTTSAPDTFFGIHVFWWLLLIVVLCLTGSEFKLGLGTGGSESGGQIVNINND